MTDIENAKKRLLEGGYTCVLCKASKVLTSTRRGVKPLLSWLEEDGAYTGFAAADKVVGKATAFLYVLLEVKEVYAAVLSRSALEVLERAGIAVEYGCLVEHIINRDGTDICPFEKAVLSVRDKEIAYSLIRQKWKEVQKNC